MWNRAGSCLGRGRQRRDRHERGAPAAHACGEIVHRSDLADLPRDMNERVVAMDQKFTWLVGSLVAGLVAVIGALVGSYYQ